mmetsp:Transcript_73121/g.200782  ORF Transcript_73121/g.200782 Transcript_73121/m.200782 type:complete len:138 (+) Transcript_73121:660-1073(+)
MTENVIGAIGIVGTDNESSISSLMNALYTAGYLDGVWESEMIWELRMAMATDLRADLSLSWNANLSMDIRDTLTISYDKMDQLRFMFSHHRVGKQLVARTWLINPWEGQPRALSRADPAALWRVRVDAPDPEDAGRA